jgi:RHS repeat-associated protein
MSKTVSGTTTPFTWNVAEGLPLLLVDGTTNYIYGPDGLPLAQITAAGAVSYYHHDQLGSTRAVTNSAGTVVATYTYDPYGKLTATTGSITNPFRYAGQYTDTETGYQYLRARYYDPGTGSFLTRDPLEVQTREAYGYVGGNPLNRVDPTGLSWYDPRDWDQTVVRGVQGAWDAGYEWSKDHLDEVSDVASYVSFVGYAVCPVAQVGCAVGVAGAWVSAGAAAGYSILNCGSSLDAHCATSLISMDIALGGLVPGGWAANAAYDLIVTFPWMIYSRSVLPNVGPC